MTPTPIPPEGSCGLAHTEDQPGRVPSILNIPVELLAKICEAVIEIPNDGPWWRNTKPPRVGLRDLARLTRVCKAFRLVARPVLFRHLDVTWLREFERTTDKEFFEGRSEYTDTAQFFRFLNTTKKNGSADLVRYLDAQAICEVIEFSDWNVEAHNRGQAFGDRGVLDELIWWVGRFWVTDRQYVDMRTPIGDCRETTGKAVLIALLLSTFRKVLAVRLPVDPGTVNLFDPKNKTYCIEDKYFGFWDDKGSRLMVGRVFFNWGGLEGNLKSPAFPHLTELELVGQVATMSHEVVTAKQLRAAHLAYILGNTPRLRTLRLFGFSSVDLGPNLDLGKITTLVLNSCSVNYREIHSLAMVCNNLKTFKISASNIEIPQRPHIWEGEEGIEETYIGDHLDDMNDPEENALLRDHDFPHLPWASKLVESSLVLQALSPASQTLENIMIGRCAEFLVDVTKGLNCKRRRMDYAKFKFLTNLGIWLNNLFLDGKSNDDVLSEIVGDAERLSCLSVFMREGFFRTVGGKCVLDRALAKLVLDLESGKVKTSLQKIRIFRAPKESAQGGTIVPASYVDSDLDSSYGETDEGATPWVTTCDLDPSTAEKLAEHGIELNYIEVSREDEDGDHIYGTLFPSHPNANHFLWDYRI